MVTVIGASPLGAEPVFQQVDDRPPDAGRVDDEAPLAVDLRAADKADHGGRNRAVARAQREALKVHDLVLRLGAFRERGAQHGYGRVVGRLSKVQPDEKGDPGRLR